jgi:HAD superfamily hydrolase (TIGR01509 family)
MVDAIIFDIGNVLLRFDFSLVTQRIAPFCASDASSIHSLLAPLKDELESGRIHGETFLQEASRIIGYTGERSLFRAAWQEIFTPIEATHRLVEQLHHSRPLFLLSNTNDLHAEYFLSQYPVFAHFQNAVYSHECGLMKPADSIYAHALEKFSLRAEQVFFIDDLAPNVKAARAAGWRAHHYREDAHHLLLTELTSLGAI